MFTDCVMTCFPSHLVDQLRAVETADDEILILGDLLLAVGNHDSTVHEGHLVQLLEEQVLESFPAKTQPASSRSVFYIDDDCTFTDNLNYLVAYVFERRFGWSEGDSAGFDPSDGCQQRFSVVRRYTLGGCADMVDDLHCKSQINEALDKLIAW